MVYKYMVIVALSLWSYSERLSLEQVMRRMEERIEKGVITTT